MLHIWQKTKHTSKLRWLIFLSTFLLITEKMSIVKCFGHNNHPVKLISWMMNITFLCNLWILPTNNQSYHDHHICQNNGYIYTVCMLTYCGALIIKSKSSEEREKKTMNMMSVVYSLFQPILIRKMLPWTNSLCVSVGALSLLGPGGQLISAAVSHSAPHSVYYHCQSHSPHFFFLSRG